MRLIKLHLVIAFCCLGSLSTWSQGLIFDDEQYEQLPRQSLYNDGGKSEEKALEGIHRKDLKPYCPTVRNQGKISSCVGWATGYGSYSIQQAIRNKWKGETATINQQALSALFIFNQIKIEDCFYGSKISEALDLLKSKGNLLSKDFDQSLEDCEKQPSSSDLAKAKKYVIQDYVTLFGPKDNQRIKVTKTKLSLVQNNPVVIAMALKMNFARIKKGKKYWIPQVGDQSPFGGHAMVVVGYDDGKEAFEIMNSWGTDWGNDGFIWVKYEDFATYCKYAFQMSLKGTLPSPILVKTTDDNPSEKNTKTYSGEINLLRPVMRIQDSVVFAQEKMILRKDQYQLEKGHWESGTIFQIEAKNFSSQPYVYAFSIDPKNELQVHWPRNELFNSKHDGFHESALITVPEIAINIPGKYSGLQVNQVGTEYLFVLCSSQAIPDLHQKLASFRATNMNSLKMDLSSHLASTIPLQAATLSPNGISFKADLKEGAASLMTIALKVE